MFDFPNNPVNGQQVTGAGGIVYQWDGVKWGAAVPFTAYAPINNPVLTGDPQAPTPATSDSDTSIATTAFVKNVIAASPPPGAIISATTPTGQNPGAMWWDTNGGQLYILYNDGNSTQWVPASNIGLANVATLQDVGKNVGRNLLHNSLFNIWQRGAGPWTASGVYTADRWMTTMVVDTASFAQAAFGDGARAQIGDEAAVLFLTNTFTGNAAANAQHYIEQHIESVRRLSGKTVTISFWTTSSNAALKLGINLYQIFGTGGSPSSFVQVLPTGISVPTTLGWVRVSATIAIPSTAGKTLGTNGDDMTILRIAYSSGATANASNGNIGVQSGTINIWGIQLEVGSTLTPLEKIDPGDDLRRCQRFYQTGQMLQASYQASGAGIGCGQLFPVTMRANPTIVVTANNNSGPFGTFSLTGSAFWVVSQAIMTGTSPFTINVNFSASADL